MLLEHERDYGLGMDALRPVCSETRMLLEHERYYGLGMDALRPVCSWNTNVSQTFAGSQSTKGNRTAGCVQA